jgi:hypothetical protein
MPEKQKTRNWKDPKTIIATICIATILTLWNTFATHDRHKTGVLKPIASTSSATPQTRSNNDCAPVQQTKNLGTKCITVTHTRSS